MNPTTLSSPISSNSPEVLISPPNASLTTVFHNHSVAPPEQILQSELMEINKLRKPQRTLPLWEEGEIDDWDRERGTLNLKEKRKERREEAGAVSEVQNRGGGVWGGDGLSSTSLLSSHLCRAAVAKGGRVVEREGEVVKSLSSHPHDLPRQWVEKQLWAAHSPILKHCPMGLKHTYKHTQAHS